MENTGFSVRDLLDTEYLRHITKVVAGEKGLSRTVSWVHILEIRDIIKDCVNGNEMILTTGIGFATKEMAINFLKELIEQNVSALCIETALYYHQIDQDLIDLANQNNFPLIEITEISRFLDIIRGLNTLLIDTAAKLYLDADHYDNQLSEISSRGTIEDGIRYTAEYLGLEVAYLPMRGKQYGVTPGLKKLIRSKLAMLEKKLKDDQIYHEDNIAIKNLKIFDRSWGYLVFKSKTRELSKFEILILNRLANKIRNDFFEKMLKEEEKLYENNKWLKKWLEGALPEVMIRKKMRASGFYDDFEGFLVCCTMLPELGSAKLFNDFILHTTIIVRRVFDEEGFSILGYMQDNIISYIVMSPKGNKDVYEKIEKAIEHLRQYKNQFVDYKKSVFSIGKKVEKCTDLKKSYETAVEALKDMAGQCGKTIIYDKLYINRIMRKLQDQYVLTEFIFDHLGALLEPNNEELLYTLKVYYECNCSKQKTAKQLFIARQTLYYRLQKIEDILGEGYEEGEKKFALEFATRAYLYLLDNIREQSKDHHSDDSDRVQKITR